MALSAKRFAARHACQCSLKGLLIGALFVCVSCGALVHPSALWAFVITNCSLCLLFVALLGAACFRGRIRASCLAFAVAGYSYLLFAHLPDGSGQSPRREGFDGPTLLLQLIWTEYHEARPRELIITPDELVGDIEIKMGGGQAFAQPEREFYQIGHSVVMVLIAWIAALLVPILTNRTS